MADLGTYKATEMLAAQGLEIRNAAASTIPGKLRARLAAACRLRTALRSEQSSGSYVWLSLLSPSVRKQVPRHGLVAEIDLSLILIGFIGRYKRTEKKMPRSSVLYVVG